ncbi:MAG TPA: TetR/AcrR family transcriptional regulator [Thermodesulfobacteriota bacterium]|nr:TetR/AcrR family transcriptional regulator [Thermodesulfobacteriota bacterium]
MDKKQLSLKIQQGRETRIKLIEAAIEVFSKDGYKNASMELIVEITGVTRGALYYHFENKLVLFEAVFDNIQAQIADNILDAANKEPDKWNQLIAGCRAFLESCIDPKIQRIAIIDAPSVLDWNTWRKVDSVHGLSLLKSTLSDLRNDGVIETGSLDALAHLLSGAMNEAALWIIQSENHKKSLDESMEMIETMLNSFKVNK